MMPLWTSEYFISSGEGGEGFDQNTNIGFCDQITNIGLWAE